MDIRFDFGGLNELVADLGELPRKTISNTRKAVEVSARKMKDDWRDNAKKSNRRGHAKRYPSAINYDLELDSDGSISAEIGPVLGGQGSLGFLEESPGGVASAPQGNARRALRSNLKDFEQGILKAAGEL